MTKQYKVVGDDIIEIFDNEFIAERKRLKLIMEKKHKINKIYNRFMLKLVLCGIASITMLYVGLFIHEFFHLLMLVLFGIKEVEFYVGTDGGYVRYMWTDELTIEEKSIVTMSGSLGTIIVFLILMIYLYSKDKMLGLIPISRIHCELHYWYNPTGESDMANYIKYNPTINFAYVNNLFLGLLILVYILIIGLFIIILFDGVKKLKEIT